MSFGECRNRIFRIKTNDAVHFMLFERFYSGRKKVDNSDIGDCPLQSHCSRWNNESCSRTLHLYGKPLCHKAREMSSVYNRMEIRPLRKAIQGVAE
ncbi:hypothetical protein CEXT_17891 [Caerostris extrusa]|uniref:Uncharacterized protein n=1 Tax=Caerostris extrusa TaxID=172846 RepID=A0AAV4NJD8_CAEEX|nr:hypothetical protein CEXT_17891 [Caerostris extrusa]